MAAALTVDDIQLIYGRDLSDPEKARAQMYIDFAEGEVEAYLGRPIHVAQFEENCFPDAAGSVYLRNTPVVSIVSVSVNNTVKQIDSFTVTAYGLENIFDLFWDYIPFDIEHVSTDAVYGGKLDIVYTAGLDYPQPIKSLVSAAVVRRIFNDVAMGNIEAQGGAGVKTIKAEDYQIGYFGPGSSTATTSTLSMFGGRGDFLSIERYKRKGIG